MIYVGNYVQSTYITPLYQFIRLNITQSFNQLYTNIYSGHILAKGTICFKTYD